jgi:hypothetical protein
VDRTGAPAVASGGIKLVKDLIQKVMEVISWDEIGLMCRLQLHSPQIIKKSRDSHLIQTSNLFNWI